MTQNDSLLEHYYMISFLLFALLMQNPPAATSQLTTTSKSPTYSSEGSPIEPPNKSMVAILIIIVFMFLLSAFISLYSRHCTRRPARAQSRRLNIAMVTGELNDRRSHSESLGLSQETIETFPTFLYSSVKGHKIRTCALACAVCIGEFEDEETLRLIPKCSHVFHPTCIDAWLASHSTCPVCRADLDPTQNDVDSSSIFSIHIPDDDVINEMEEEQGQSNEQEDAIADIGGRDQNDLVESFSPKADLLRRSRTVNDVITGQTLRSLLFPRSNSAGTSLTTVRTGDKDFERFTLRLPSGVRSEVFMNSRLKRAKTCVGLVRMSSGTKGYRTGSVGNCRGDYDRWRFTSTPPFFSKNWTRLGRRSASAQCLGVEVDNNNVGEPPFDLLFFRSTPY